MSIPAAALEDMPPEPYAEVRAKVRDADLLLCSAHDAFSRLIRWSTQSCWSHVAIAFRLEEIGRVMVLECVERIGVRAVPLSRFIARTSSGVEPYPGKILLARHTAIATEAGQPMRTMAASAFDRLGEPFSQAEVAKIAARIAAGRLGRRLPPVLEPDDEYICSEYVARCYAALGLQFAWNGLGFIAPADIARDPCVMPVAQIQLPGAKKAKAAPSSVRTAASASG